MDWLKKLYTPMTSFKDLQYRWELFTLRYETCGLVNLLATSIQHISAKICEIEVTKANKFRTNPSLPSDRDLIAVLVRSLPPEFDPEVRDTEKNMKMTFTDVLEELWARELKNRPD